MGPINEWWTAGFDGGQNALTGFSTGKNGNTSSSLGLLESKMTVNSIDQLINPSVINAWSYRITRKILQMFVKIIDTLKPELNGCNFADNNFKCILLHSYFIENCPKGKSSLVQVIGASSLIGTKPLPEPVMTHITDIWVRSRNCSCLVTWFCYQLIAKPGNKMAAVSWPDPYTWAPWPSHFFWWLSILSVDQNLYWLLVL